MTTPRRPDDDLERLLQDDGGDLGALYRRLPRSDPPRRLDRAVLGNAARAVRGNVPHRQRWVVGLGSAAGLVLAAGIAWHVGQDALRQQAVAPARTEKPSFVPVQPIEDTRARREIAPAAPGAPQSQQQNAPLPQAATGGAEDAKVRHRASRADAARANEASAPAAEPAVAAAAPPPPSPPPAGPVAARPAPVPAPFPAAADKAAAGTAASSSSLAAKQGAHDEAEAPAMRGAAPSPSSSAELRRDTQLAPEAWLAHIRQLFQQGRRQQAIESLRLFRRAHPDWAISDEWRRLSD